MTHIYNNYVQLLFLKLKDLNEDLSNFFLDFIASWPVSIFF